MGILERIGIRGREPEPPITPASFTELMDLIKTRGVRNFVAVQPFSEYRDDLEDQVVATTRMFLTTKDGRWVEFSEEYGVQTRSDETDLRIFLTAEERAQQLRLDGSVAANLIEGWFGESGDVLRASKMDVMYRHHLLSDASKLGLEAFELPQQQAA